MGGNATDAERLKGLPPHGGSGLKWSVRNDPKKQKRLPPHGGSGLKLLQMAEGVEQNGLPPHGGSGLKSQGRHDPRRGRPVSLHTEGVD